MLNFIKKIEKKIPGHCWVNGSLQSVERSCPIDGCELVYLDKEWAGRGGSLLSPLDLIANWI